MKLLFTISLRCVFILNKNIIRKTYSKVLAHFKLCITTLQTQIGLKTYNRLGQFSLKV